MALFRCGENGQKAVSGSVQYTNATDVVITTGFKPKYVDIIITSTTKPAVNLYNEDYSSTQFIYGGATTYPDNMNLGGTAHHTLHSIDSNGFTVNKSNSSTPATLYYFAVG